MITKPKGTKDIYGIEAKKWQYVSKVIDEVMEKYNYNFIRVPVFESSELFHRGVGETTDIVTKETYEFEVNDKDMKIVTIPVGYTHNIENIGDNDMILIIWCNELFDKDKPDTYYKTIYDKNIKKII